MERLWRIAKSVLNDNKRSISPNLFEFILFVKMNENVLDLITVSEALHMVPSMRSKKKGVEHNKCVEIWDDN